MVADAVAGSVRSYLEEVKKGGVPVAFGVVFGSYASGEAHEWSDIDLAVVSPKYDEGIVWEDVSLLWRVAARTDSRIEPIPAGVREFAEDSSRPILTIARREGRKLTLA